MPEAYRLYWFYEYKVIKYLAVGGFVLALIVALIITFNSGILGGGSSASVAAETTGTDTVATPADSAAPAATATTGTRSHIVADGDSFSSIARQYDVTISEIQQLNPNINPQNLTPGTKLVIP